MLEMSARCPQKCPMCPLQGSDERMAREEGLMEPELFRSLIDQMVDHPPEVLRLHYSGESTVHPQFAELAMYARKKLPSVHLQMNTGGLLWTTDEKRRAWLACGIDLLTFSIEANRWLHDGIDSDGNPWNTSTKRADVHAESRKFVIHPHRAGAPWDLTAGNLLKTAILLRQMQQKNEGHSRRVNLHVQHLVTKEVVPSESVVNGDQPFVWELEMSRAFWEQFGVLAKWVPVANIGGQVDNNDLKNPAFDRRAAGTCREVWTNFIVSWDGRVAPCCVDHAFALLPAVDLKKVSYLAAWNHPALTSLRERHREMKGIPEKCRVCLAST